MGALQVWVATDSFGWDVKTGSLWELPGVEFCKSAATGGATCFWLLAVSLGVLRAEFCSSAATGMAGGLRMPSPQPGAAVPQVFFHFIPSPQPGWGGVLSSVYFCVFV